MRERTVLKSAGDGATARSTGARVNEGRNAKGRRSAGAKKKRNAIESMISPESSHNLPVAPSGLES